MANWLLFTYRVPNEPSARRVYVWRKLRRLGAILLHGAAWALPANSYTRENLQWLAAEVLDMEGGEATLWEAQRIFTGQEDRLAQQFTDQVDASYREILDALDASEPDLAVLSKRYQQARRVDYFQSKLGEQVRTRLVDMRGLDNP